MAQVQVAPADPGVSGLLRRLVDVLAVVVLPLLHPVIALALAPVFHEVGGVADATA